MIIEHTTETVEKLADILLGKNLESVTVKNGSFEVSITARGCNSVDNNGANAPRITTISSINVEDTSEKQTPSAQKTSNIVTAPIIGTFYSAPSEDAPAYVKVGDKVKKGQVIAIIESMKLMNELQSEFDGEVAEIFVKDEEIVEFGQKIMSIV